MINKLADLIERDSDILAELESMNTGKGIRIVKDFDLADTVACLRYYAGWADKITGETLDVGSKSKLAWTLSEPSGVCGQM